MTIPIMGSPPVVAHAVVFGLAFGMLCLCCALAARRVQTEAKSAMRSLPHLRRPSTYGEESCPASGRCWSDKNARVIVSAIWPIGSLMRWGRPGQPLGVIFGAGLDEGQ